MKPFNLFNSVVRQRIREKHTGLRLKRMPKAQTTQIAGELFSSFHQDEKPKSAATSWGYEDGPWKGPGPPLLGAADF